MGCNNQIDRKGMQELKVLPGSIYVTNLVRKILSESAIIRRTSRKCHNQRTSRKCNNQKHFQEVSQSKVLPGSAVIMGISMQYHKKCIQGVLQLKVNQGSVAINSAARECSQFKYLRKCHNQKS